MKLFSDDNVEQKESSIVSAETRNKTVIISPRVRVLDDIHSSLLMYDIDDTETIKQNFLNIADVSIAQGVDIIIADIADCSDLINIKQVISVLVPVNTRCILLGENDSIAFGKEINKLGVDYLHLTSQLQELPELVLEKSSNTLMRGTIIFSVLGCKGGSGTSSFCYDLLQTAGKMSTIPLLMVQGASGSLDLDLLLGRAIPKDGSIVPFDKNISVKMESKDNPWSFEDQNFNRFNMVFIDNPVYNCSQDKLDYMLKRSYNLLLIITRDLSSLRVAKTIIDDVSRRSVPGNINRATRIFICLNDYRPSIKKQLTNDDIEEYLGQKIDAVRSYQQDSKINNNDDSLSVFASMLLGKKIIKKKSSPKDFLGKFLSKK
ncbi:hypothetical protein WN53_12400 [Serratia fonticola]|uniref:hypothetical protein n=1 Tax=Serratia fonticola TaxID=47917 RepID=UPI00062A0F20|nr:hypothetical protein [Serratia fonticola]AKG69849.1 hypothetical protein WN53_12400 [Serratia fonticola]CAI1637519.1 Flp pilus assembly protein, ATPase CpaE [Serratia fonticola]